jgi:hypothetical protein
LTVSIADPNPNAWTALMATVCGGALIGLWVVFEIIRYGWSDEQFWVKSYVAIHIAMIPAAIALMAFCRRFQALRRTTQWAFALIAFVLAFGGYLVIVIGLG